jgi:hypothetical protein
MKFCKTQTTLIKCQKVSIESVFSLRGGFELAFRDCGRSFWKAEGRVVLYYMAWVE